MSSKIKSGSVVGYRFTMRDSQGEVVGEVSGEDVTHYLHGADNIPPGLEKALEGHGAGDSFSVQVNAEDAFGERQEVEPLAVPRASFPSDAPIETGAQVMAETPDGEVVALWVSEANDEHVLLDPNHPLAGEPLSFDLEVVSVRAATEEEIEHGHPHEGDHHH
jgi:FKBP-type peptidyl-prolyl cis-trans isomerase SlyD